MATQGTSRTPLTLAVYVVGISGNCSEDYIGCGKSCLCRQFVHNEYVEELYSTLLQAEFDSGVIGHQHVIYWGQKQETYKASESIEEPKMSTFSANVNYEIFEHTILYEDASGLPFTGKPYNQQIFTPLNKFFNKLSFKSRDLILSPDEYEVKTFSYIYKVPTAYLYVVDVSQSCPVFMKQLELMNNLIKSIKNKKNYCVILANKYDAHSQENMENLEMWANALDISVIQCSAKYNINVDTAFRYLAMKVFSRQLSKKFSINIQPYAEIAVDKQRAISTGNSDKSSVYINTIPHIDLANEVNNSTPNSQAAHSDLMSQAVTDEIKRSITDDESQNYACFYNIEEDDYYYVPLDDKPIIHTDMEKLESDNLLNDVDDDREEAEVEYPLHAAKRSASFRKGAFSSFRRSFKTKSRAVPHPVKKFDSLPDSCVIANEHVGTESSSSVQHTRESAVNHLNTRQSLLSSRKKMCSNSK